MAVSGPPNGLPDFGVESDPRPIVRRPPAGLPGSVIAIIAAMLALALFVVLDGRRRHTVSKPRDSLSSAFPAPPTLTLPPEAHLPLEPAQPAIVTMPLPVRTNREPDLPRPSIAQTPQPVIVVRPPAPAEPAGSRSNEPALVLDAVSGDSGAPASNASGTTNDDAPVRTTVIRNRTTIMPVGTIIPAVLETPIDSTRPGLVRAIVSEDARGFDGRQVLIPRGSRLIGEYQSDVRSGQNRVLVTWTRLIRPDGVAIRIGSPAADMLGGAGIPGHVNSFFFQRFASAVLQSALTVGVNLASRPGNGSVIVGLPTSNTGAIGQDLIPGSDLKPKIKVKQGAVLDIFVAHDLDFSGSPYPLQDKAH